MGRFFKSAHYLVLAAVVAALVLGCVHLVPVFRGNLALAACLDRYQGHEPGPAACAAAVASPAQQAALALARAQMAWRSGAYASLAQNCGVGLCDCFPAGTSGEPSFQDRMQAYLAALSYRLVNGHFPKPDRCGSLLMSSQSAWVQANRERAAGNQALADALGEYAFLVNYRWQNQRERGCSAYSQALRYRELGDQDAAKRTFQIAITDLQPVYNPNDGPVVTCLSTSLVLLADIHASEGNLESAIDGYQRALQVNVTSPFHWLRLAQLQEQRGDIQAVHLTLQEALEHHPDNQPLRDALAKLAGKNR